MAFVKPVWIPKNSRVSKTPPSFVVRLTTKKERRVIAYVEKRWKRSRR